MKTRYHRLLERQIKKHLDAQNIPESMKSFFEAVSQSYRDCDEDLKMLERSMTISSKELAGINADLNAIFQAIPDLFLKIDMEGTILDCKTGNSHELYFVESRMLLKKRIQDVPDEDARIRISEALEAIRKEKSRINIEYALCVKGEEKFYEARFVPFSETQYVVIIRAITEKKKWEKEINDTVQNLKLFKQVTVDRELKMIELKKEINAMAKQLGKEEPYDLSALE